MTRDALSISTIIQQKATANFDGTLPAGDPILSAEGIYRYPAEANGGLIYWNGVKEPMIISSFLCTLALGNATLYLVNLDSDGTPIAGEVWELASVTGGITLNLPDYDLTVLQTQALKLVTTTAAIAEACGSIERMHRH